MPADVLAQLSSLGDLFDDLVPPVTVEELMSLGDVADDQRSEAPGIVELHASDGPPRRWWAWRVAGAAAVVVLAVGAVTILRHRPAPVAPVAAADEYVGVFPVGGRDGAVLAGYADPVAVAQAYVADLTDPQHLPSGYTVTATVGQVTPAGDDTAVVNVSLQTPDDSGDALVVVRRLDGATGPVWQVAAAGVFADELRDVNMAAGQLTGVIAPGAGGMTYLYAYDPATGALLDSAVVDMPLVAGPAATRNTAPFTLDTGSATNVTLRYWNIVDPIKAYAFANFADVPVAAGVDRFATAWDVLASRRANANADSTKISTLNPASSPTSALAKPGTTP